MSFVKTFVAKKQELDPQWYLVDAKDQILGRLSSRIASILRGKHRPQFSPHQDFGDHVVVINAEKIRLTGRKEEQKQYFRHSGYPGGVKETSIARIRATKPEHIIEHAVRGMLPKNKLGRKLARKLHVYAGSEHPHHAQQPETVILEEIWK
jgi:large subunit ribosomal protein L13